MSSSEEILLPSPEGQKAVTSPIIDTTLAFPSDGIQPQVFDVFIHACGGRNKLQNLTTSEVCQKYLLPLTHSPNPESYTEQLRRENPAMVGKATVFVSHAWRFEFISLVDALLDQFSDQLSGGEVYLWFDLFSNNQHLAPDLPFEWWCGTFKSAIRDIHHTVLVLEPWHDPVPFTRVWCLWEIFCTVDTESHLDICMTPGNESHFMESILHDSGAFFDMLATIDVRNSDAWNPADKEKIFDVVQKTVGFEAVNTIILKHMRVWVLEVLRGSIIKDKTTASTSTAITVDVFDKQLCLASLLRKQGLFAEALAHNSECLDYSTAAYGANDPKTLTAMNNIGMLYKVMGKRNEALPLYEACLERRRAVFGVQHIDTLHSMNNLAIVYKAMGNYNAAQALFEECLNQRTTLLGDTHSSTLASMNNLANLYRATGTMEQALPLYEECYKKKITSLGASHPDTLNSMNNLAVAYKALEREDEALQLYEDCWALRKEKLGPSHPDSLASMNNIARMYESMERYEEAMKLFEECWQMRRSKSESESSSNHRAALTSMDNLASCYMQMGRLDDALVLFQSCFEKRTELFGESDGDTLSSHHNLAHLLATLDKDIEALQMFEMCVTLRTAAWGEHHPHTLSSQIHLGKQLQKLNRLDEAVVILEAVYAKRTAQLGMEHSNTISTMSSLASLLREMQEYTRAQELYKTCLVKRTETKGVHHVLTRVAMCGLALVYAGMGQGEKGIEVLQDYILLAKESIATAGAQKVMMPQNTCSGDQQTAVTENQMTSCVNKEAAAEEQSTITTTATTATTTTTTTTNDINSTTNKIEDTKREEKTRIMVNCGNVKQHTAFAVADEECIIKTNIAVACIYFMQGKIQESEHLFRVSIKELAELKGAHSLDVRAEAKAYARITGKETHLELA